MIDRREWIKTCIAAAGAALLDTSGLPVVQPDADEESSVSVSTSGRPIFVPHFVLLEAWGDSDSDGYRSRYLARCSH